MQDLLTCLDSPELPFLQWQECLAVLANRLPKDLRNEVNVLDYNFSPTLLHNNIIVYPLYLKKSSNGLENIGGVKGF